MSPYTTKNGITTYRSYECMNNAHSQCNSPECMCPKCHFDRMSPKDEMLSIRESVYDLLKEYPNARKSDQLLQFLFVTKILNVGISFLDWNALSRVKFESINRIARDLKSKYPELKPPEEVQSNKDDAEREVRKMFAGGE